jgi:hypothetical protein
MVAGASGVFSRNSSVASSSKLLSVFFLLLLTLLGSSQANAQVRFSSGGWSGLTWLTGPNKWQLLPRTTSRTC